MSLQLTLIAGLLFVEIAAVLILSIPVVSPSKWHKLFKSKVMKAILQQTSKYFTFILFALVLFLCDSIRELRKYSEISAEDRDKFAQLDAEMLVQLRLFRAQRNFYMCGFALVLSFVIRRLIELIDEQARLLKSLRNQAQSGPDEKSEGTKGSADQDKRYEELKEKLKMMESELSREKKDKEAVISQCDSLKRRIKTIE